jgi:hypothetical protein
VTCEVNGTRPFVPDPLQTSAPDKQIAPHRRFRHSVVQPALDLAVRASAAGDRRSAGFISSAGIDNDHCIANGRHAHLFA